MEEVSLKKHHGESSLDWKIGNDHQVGDEVGLEEVFGESSEL